MISLRGGPRAPSWVTGVGLPTLVPALLGGGRRGLLTTSVCRRPLPSLPALPDTGLGCGRWFAHFLRPGLV